MERESLLINIKRRGWIKGVGQGSVNGKTRLGREITGIREYGNLLEECFKLDFRFRLWGTSGKAQRMLGRVSDDGFSRRSVTPGGSGITVSQLSTHVNARRHMT